MISITALNEEDRAGWEVLAKAYNAFYKKTRAASEYERTWQRLMTGDSIYGLGAYLDGKLVGIAHYLFHSNIWSAGDCYLQDLFVDNALRGRGIARSLIERVAEEARQRGVISFYWLTHVDNHTARVLYDRVAQNSGFICYDYALG